VQTRKHADKKRNHQISPRKLNFPLSSLCRVSFPCRSLFPDVMPHTGKDFQLRPSQPTQQGGKGDRISPNNRQVPPLLFQRRARLDSDDSRLLQSASATSQLLQARLNSTLRSARLGSVHLLGSRMSVAAGHEAKADAEAAHNCPLSLRSRLMGFVCHFFHPCLLSFPDFIFG